MLNQILIPKKFSMRDTFGIDVASEAMIEGFEIPENLPGDLSLHADFLRSCIPKKDTGYRFRKELLSYLNFWWQYSKTDVLTLFGPTGSGKTSLFEQWCAYLGIPIFSLKGHNRLEPYEAFGQFVAGNGGETLWTDGPITMAAQYGLPVIINEFDRIAPTRSIIFNDVFENRAFPVPGKPGYVAQPREGFCVVVTANTNLVEDLSGNYGTANSHDTSILERMYSVKVDYPQDDDTETNIILEEIKDFGDDLLEYWFDQEGLTVSTSVGLKKGPSITRKEFATALVDYARQIRKQSKDSGSDAGDALERTISTRMLRKLARHAALSYRSAEMLGKSALHRALRTLVSNQATESTALALHEGLTAVFGVQENIK